MTFIKPDPELQEEQEDLVMSYLNTDYLTEQPLSPPDSTTSSETTGSPEKQMVDAFSPDKQLVDEFMFEQGTDFFNPNWLDTTTNTALPLYNQDILSGLPFYLTTPILPQQPVEQPKKKRGRKKRDSVQPAAIAQASLLAPKPLAPKPLVKIETTPTVPTIPEPPKPEIKVKQQLTQEAQKQLQIQKRQERLIKNRAAALLSRKRKREHLTNLEDENKKLVEENEQLSEKVNMLENKLQLLEKENMELKAKMYPPTVHVKKSSSSSFHTPKSTKATSVVFMIMLFSFALFSLPSRTTTNQLTVGGSSAFEHKKQFPLIGSSSYKDQDTTDLILIDSVRPRDLQTWINHKLDVSQEEEQDSIYDKFIHWYQPPKNNKSQVYLYSKEFSQLASLNNIDESLPPLISIFSPYNQTVEEEQCDSYLQIDVQVLRSSVIKGQLFSLDKYGTPSISLLDGIKNEYIHNVTRDDSIVKREKRTRKLSKVL